MKVYDTKEQVYFDEYRPEELDNIINTQRTVVHCMINTKMKKFYSILIVIDDHADDTKFVRYSKLLHGLFSRGRHDAISVICSTQKYNVLAPIIRLNASSLYIFRLKNASELMSFTEENSAVLDKEIVTTVSHGSGRCSIFIYVCKYEF